MTPEQITARIKAEKRKYDNIHYPKDFWVQVASAKIWKEVYDSGKSGTFKSKQQVIESEYEKVMVRAKG